MSARFMLIFTLLGLFFCTDIGVIADNKVIIYDLPDAEIEKMMGKGIYPAMSAEEIAQTLAYRFKGPDFRLLVIPIHWADRLSTYSQATLDSFFFSVGEYPGGSVVDYFTETSYGQVTVTGQVLDWQLMGEYDPYMYLTDFEDAFDLVDPFVDFSQFDGDNDGVVDAVVLLRSGTGQEDTGSPNDIWSFAVSYSPGHGAGPYDGVLISHWNTTCEEFPLRDPIYPTYFTGYDSLNKINTFCHELGHNMGLPDLYDYDDKIVTSTYYTPNDGNDHPIMDWCIMGYGGYGLFSISKSTALHYSGWCKMELGWVDPIALIGTFEDLVIYDIETHADSSLYLVPIDPARGEYFLLEYRNPHSTGQFDKVNKDYSVYFYPDLTFGADTIDQGLIVYHVHDPDSLLPYYETRINSGWPTYEHYSVAVVDAGYNPSRNYTSNPEGDVTDSAQWWYPYETRLGAAFSDDVDGQNLLSPETYPSSDGYYGPSGVVIRVDSIVNEKLYVYVYSPNGDPDEDGVYEGFDNCPYLPNPDQANSDGDDYGDLCDNCPSIPNTDQANSDEDDFGNLCDNCPEETNPGQEDGDDDNIGNLCDNCPDLPNTDQANTDEDDIGDLCDNCPEVTNPDQTDGDADGTGDLCDNCRYWYNPDQADLDENGTGDICDGRCGDANGDTMINVGDAVYLLAHIFQEGPPPEKTNQGDPNCDGNTNIGDAVFMVNHVFSGGPSPCSTCE